MGSSVRSWDDLANPEPKPNPYWDDLAGNHHATSQKLWWTVPWSTWACRRVVKWRLVRVSTTLPAWRGGCLPRGLGDLLETSCGLSTSVDQSAVAHSAARVRCVVSLAESRKLIKGLAAEKQAWAGQAFQ